MSNFKPKTKHKKKIKVSKKTSLTLDGKHNEILDDFCYDETVFIPELKKEYEELKKKIELNNNEKSNTSKPLTIDEKMNIQTKLINNIWIKMPYYKRIII